MCIFNYLIGGCQQFAARRRRPQHRCVVADAQPDPPGWNPAGGPADLLNDGFFDASRRHFGGSRSPHF
jgi:hypothetical protein